MFVSVCSLRYPGFPWGYGYLFSLSGLCLFEKKKKGSCNLCRRAPVKNAAGWCQTRTRWRKTKSPLECGSTVFLAFWPWYTGTICNTCTSPRRHNLKSCCDMASFQLFIWSVERIVGLVRGLVWRTLVERKMCFVLFFLFFFVAKQSRVFHQQFSGFAWKYLWLSKEDAFVRTRVYICVYFTCTFSYISVVK